MRFSYKFYFFNFILLISNL
jgi:hypothetical protein